MDKSIILPVCLSLFLSLHLIADVCFLYGVLVWEVGGGVGGLVTKFHGSSERFGKIFPSLISSSTCII